MSRRARTGTACRIRPLLAALGLVAALLPAGRLGALDLDDPGTLTDPASTDPHGRRALCRECHELDPASGAPSMFLPQSCTRCHSQAAHDRRIHRVTLSAAEMGETPVQMPLAEGASDCRTCHLFACQEGSGGIPVALRGSPFPKPVDFCYQCHRREDYQSLYPHSDRLPLPVGLTRQHRALSDPLERQLFRCGVCHIEVKSAFGFNEITVGRLQASATEICRKCHIKSTHQYMHVGVSVQQNTVRPDAAHRLAAFQRKSRIRLPLIDNRQISCSTCHLPHDMCGRSLMAGDSLAERSRLRITPAQLCIVCHDAQ